MAAAPAAFPPALLSLLASMHLYFLAVAQLAPPDLAALQAVHRWLHDAPGANPSFFASWDFTRDPCSFDGVLCDILDGHERVAGLNLGIASGSSAGLRGRLHPALGSLSALVQLTLAPGKVEGAIPSTLAQLTHLQNLGLSHNLLTGSIPSGLVSLSRLATLDLAFNRLSGSIPAELAALPSLVTLRLAHNRLTGRLPPSFANAHSLNHLDIKRNSLEGPLPVLPPSLTYLDLARNRLTGELVNLAKLRSLSFLDLSENQLSGMVPVSLFSAPLASLSLQRNLLSGPLSPLELVVIPTVDLAFNQLAGPISPFFAFVRNLYLNNNRFKGAVPQEFVDQLLTSAIQTLFLQHNFLTDFPLSPGSSFPVTASVCIQYNCKLPPVDSPWPHSAGTRSTRPPAQCKNT